MVLSLLLDLAAMEAVAELQTNIWAGQWKKAKINSRLS
jgi:hypothetical protein